MESLNSIVKRTELAPQSNVESTLALASQKRLPDVFVIQLGTWMAEAQANFPKQTLPPGTDAMWLARWEEIAAKYGMETFKAALSKLLQDAWMPEPHELRERCQAIRRQTMERDAAATYLKQLADEKAQWERERMEDTA